MSAVGIAGLVLIAVPLAFNAAFAPLAGRLGLSGTELPPPLAEIDEA